MAGNPFNACDWYLLPSDKKKFAEWLINLKDEDLVCDKFNGFMYDKTYKSIKDLYMEWWNGPRLIQQQKDIEALMKK